MIPGVHVNKLLFDLSFESIFESHFIYRRLADGTVHCAGSATYEICFRLPIPNPNPNPITDPNTNPNPNPNPKINQKQNDTGMKFNIE